MTGELKRAFFKHKIYGTLHAVQIDEKGEVLAARDVAESTACQHALAGYELAPDAIAEFNDHKRDYELVEPPCTNPTHLLADIGSAEVECAAAERDFEEAHRISQSKKKIFESKQARLREIVREATNPRPLPLFAEPAA